VYRQCSSAFGTDASFPVKAAVFADAGETLALDEQQERGSRLLLGDEWSCLLAPADCRLAAGDQRHLAGSGCPLERALGVEFSRHPERGEAIEGSRRPYREIVRSVDAYGEGLGKPVVEGASLQGEVVSRTYPHHFPERL
jgi:hypothetical protein